MDKDTKILWKELCDLVDKVNQPLQDELYLKIIELINKEKNEQIYG
jgi:hypothetical protein